MASNGLDKRDYCNNLRLMVGVVTFQISYIIFIVDFVVVIFLTDSASVSSLALSTFSGMSLLFTKITSPSVTLSTLILVGAAEEVVSTVVVAGKLLVVQWEEVLGDSCD